MKLRNGFFGWAQILVAGGFLSLAGSEALGQRVPAVVDARIVLATDGAHPGSKLESAVVAQVSPGYHINEHNPTLDYLIPTQVKLEVNSRVRVEKIVYPKGKFKKFAFSETSLSVYEGTVVMGALLKVAPGVPPGTYTLNGKLAYQACNDHACLPPTSVPLALSVKVVRPGVPLKRANANVFNGIKFE